jgi:hypothetical protein
MDLNEADKIPRTGRCAQCGKASTMRWVRIIRGVLRVGEFCDSHGPRDIWQSTAKQRWEAEKRMRAQTGLGW